MNITAEPSPSHRFAAWQLAGLVAFVPHLIAVVLASAQRPGFDHRAQFLSELGERGSTSAFVVNFLGVAPTGVLFAIFGVGLLLHFRTQRSLAVAGAFITLHGLCRVLAACFPCDAGCRPIDPSTAQLVHNASATVAFVSLTAALFTVGAWLIKRRRRGSITTVTYVIGGLALVAQAMLLIHPYGGNVGLYQRVALGSLQLWVAILAFNLMSRRTHGNDA